MTHTSQQKHIGCVRVMLYENETKDHIGLCDCDRCVFILRGPLRMGQCRENGPVSICAAEAVASGVVILDRMDDPVRPDGDFCRARLAQLLRRKS